MRQSFVFLILILSGMIILNHPVFAQGVSIGLSPLTFELTASPGDVIENYLKVYNSSDSIIGIKMQVEDITPTGEIGHVIVEPPETETYSLARWVKSEPEEFSLNPKEEKFVQFTITVPKNAEPGGHYGAVLAGTKAIAGPGATGAAIVQRIGALVLLTIPGEMREEVIVKEFTTSRYSEYGPIPFLAKFENKGTVHVKPAALITITDFKGKKVAEIALPQGNVLPKAIRKFEASWDKKWLWAGKYTATLTGSFGRGNTPFSSVVITFWAFPWKVGLGVLIVLILLILSRRRWLAAFRVLIKGESRS